MTKRDDLYKKYEPKYCSNCGYRINDNMAIYNIDKFGEYGWGYDSYCKTCGWSGDILPNNIMFEMEDL